jgi:hypothetical protein
MVDWSDDEFKTTQDGDVPCSFVIELALVSPELEDLPSKHPVAYLSSPFHGPAACPGFSEQVKKDAIDIIIHGTQYLNTFEMEEPSLDGVPPRPDSKWP